MSQSDNVKKEISKKFDLPERQSKLQSMLRQENQLYCICRSSDSTSFMIACDGCEDWYHGICVGITQEDSKKIKRYFCDFCVESNQSLRTQYKTKSTSGSQAKEKTEISNIPNSASSKPSTSATKVSDGKRGRPPSSVPRKRTESRRETTHPPPNVRDRCGGCDGCLRKEDCGSCDVCLTYSILGTRNRQLCSNRMCIIVIESQAQTETQSSQVPVLSSRNVQSSSSSSEESLEMDKSRDTTKPKILRKSSSDRREDSCSCSSDDDSNISEDSSSDSSESEELRQCKGPGCINPARKASSYCSDTCGINLASKRIYNILPGRIHEYTMKPCIADLHDSRELEENRKKIITVRSDLAKLEDKRKRLDEHIATMEEIDVEDGHEHDEPEEEGSIYCITCGHEVAMKSCMRHMDKCFKKWESQTSFGSVYKTNVEGTPLFCDFFNPANGTYCKRLAVICPDHSKDPKIREKAICGFRLMDSSLNETGDFCRVSKKRCNQHFAWERINRGTLDIERVTQYLKLDDLLEQERQLQGCMANRGGVMGLLLNSVFDHDLRAHIQKSNETNSGEDKNRLGKNLMGKEKMRSGIGYQDTACGKATTEIELSSSEGEELNVVDCDSAEES